MQHDVYEQLQLPAELLVSKELIQIYVGFRGTMSMFLCGVVMLQVFEKNKK